MCQIFKYHVTAPIRRIDAVFNHKETVVLFGLLFLSILTLLLSSVVVASPSTSRSIYQDTLRTESLDQIVVTATRTALKQSQTGKITSVITPAMMQKSRGKSLANLLQEHSLLYINGAFGSPGSNQELSLWGGSSGYTLLLLDGVPLRDPSQINQTADLNHINPEQIERIEILNGAQSTLWGSDAVAGVINIITNSSAVPHESSVSDVNTEFLLSPYLTLSRGSTQENIVQTGVNGSIGNLAMGFSYGYRGSTGISTAIQDGNEEENGDEFDLDGFTQHRALLNTSYRVNQELKLQYRGILSSYDTELDAGAFQDDRDFTAERELWTHSLSADYERNRWKLSLQQSWTQSDRYLFDDSTHVGGFAKWSEGRYEGEASITDLFGVFEFSDAFSIVSGAQFIRQQTQQSYQSISAFGLFEAIPITRKDSRTAAYSLYSSLLFESGQWNAEAGFRLNSHSIYYKQTTFTFNPSVRIQDRARVFVNVSTGYKIPSLYQLYSEYGNLSLTPESSFNIETGVQLELFDRMLDLRLVGFKRDIKDLIVFYTDENWVSFYVNRDEQNDIGFEVDSRIFLGQYLSWRNRALFVEGEGKSDGIKSKNLYRRPNVLLNSLVLINPSQTWSLQTSFRFVGSRLKGPFDIGPDRLSSYYTLSFYGEYQLNSLLVLFADLQNSTGQKFEEVPGYSTQGRYLTIGASLRW